MDDVLIAGNDKSLINAARDWLFSNFDMKDMDEANYILGVRIVRNRSKRFLSLSQDVYIQRILERFQMQSCKPVDTPIEKSTI